MPNWKACDKLHSGTAWEIDVISYNAEAVEKEKRKRLASLLAFLLFFIIYYFFKTINFRQLAAAVESAGLQLKFSGFESLYSLSRVDLA